MPNPLTNPHLNQSRRQDAVRGDVVFDTTGGASSDTVQPELEFYSGQNFPYRGTQAHGVDPNATPEEVPGYEMGVGVEYAEPVPEPEPVPVRIVQYRGRERRRLRVIVAYAGGTNYGKARQILGEDDCRTSARIKNNGANTVWISHSAETATDMFGYPLATGQDYQTLTQEAVYASVEDALDAPVSIAIEYSVEL